MKQKLLCTLHIEMFSLWVFMQTLAFGCSPSLSLSTELKTHTHGCSIFVKCMYTISGKPASTHMYKRNGVPLVRGELRLILISDF